MKEYGYHITEFSSWDKIVLLRPRKRGFHRADFEPEVARICVCPSIQGCLLALCGCIPPDTRLFVYRTKDKTELRKPYNIPDSDVTEEKWIVEPTIFKLIAHISLNRLPYLNWNGYWGGTDRGDDAALQYLKMLKERLIQEAHPYIEWAGATTHSE